MSNYRLFRQFGGNVLLGRLIINFSYFSFKALGKLDFRVLNFDFLAFGLCVLVSVFHPVIKIIENLLKMTENLLKLL